MRFDKTILVIGFGSIGKRHVKNILEQTNSEIIIFTKRKNIVNNEIQKISRNKNRIKISNNLKNCLTHDPKIAFITNETSLHIDFAIKLAKLGISLFIEKPLSNSIQKINYLEKICQKKKIQSMIGCNLRFYPPILKIKHLIERKTIGKIISIQCENGSYLPDWHPNENYSKSYAAKSVLGGGVTLTQIHELDYLMWIFGDIQKIYSITGKFSHLKVSADDLSASLLQLKNEAIVELHLDYFSRPYYKQLKIRGTKGILYWNSNENTVKLFNLKTQKWKNLTVKNNYKLSSKKLNQMYVDEINYFFTCIIKNKKPMNNISEAKNTLKNALNILK